MAYGSNVNVTPGTGKVVRTFTNAASEEIQVVREHAATAITTNTWTVSATASTSQIAADATRVGVIMVSIATVRVYLRFDSTAPTTTAFHWFLDPADRYEVPVYLRELAVSMDAESAGGTIVSVLATAA